MEHTMRAADIEQGVANPNPPAVALSAEIIQDIELAWVQATRQSTHWHGCHKIHPACAIALLLEELERFRKAAQVTT